MPSHVPHTSGIYLFKRKNHILYVGKAVNLEKRLSSYWRKNAGDKIRQMREEATTVEWLPLPSEIEALIKEAELIKRHLPKFNVLMRDDKSYFYVGITKDQYPRIFLAHKNRMRTSQSRVSFIGPYTSGASLKMALKFLRRMFPYCTCTRPHHGTCLNSQIDRCVGFCCNKKRFAATTQAMHDEYHANIRSIIDVLGGKKKNLASRLLRQMRLASRSQEFEKAARLRNQINGLENIFSHHRVLTLPHIVLHRRTHWHAIENIVQRIFDTTKQISRVEGYDISNISGTAATGSMVVFINGKPVKSEYRKFRIKTVHHASDVDMHKEVMRRRLAHPEWHYPDLMVIDGGRPQLNAVRSVVRDLKLHDTILIAGLAKREEELYIPGHAHTIRLDSLPEKANFFFQNVRDESHRFAKKYHHVLRAREIKN